MQFCQDFRSGRRVQIKNGQGLAAGALPGDDELAPEAGARARRVDPAAVQLHERAHDHEVNALLVGQLHPEEPLAVAEKKEDEKKRKTPEWLSYPGVSFQQG